MDLISNLIEFGLSEKEAQAYIALIELEVATANELAEKANLNRSSAYVILEGLKEKGLASVSAGERTRKYIAASPETLMELAAEASDRQRQAEQSINKILPDLRSLFKGTKKKPKVRIFEGKRGLIDAFEDSISKNYEVIKVISSGMRLFAYFPEYIIEYVKKRSRLGIRTIGIHPLDIPSEEVAKNLAHGDVAILIPALQYKFQSEIAIYGNKVGFVSTNDESAVVIEDERIAKVMNEVFDLAVVEAKRIGTVVPLEKDR